MNFQCYFVGDMNFPGWWHSTYHVTLLFKSFSELPLIVRCIKPDSICLVSRACNNPVPPLLTTSSPMSLQHDSSLLLLPHSWSSPWLAPVVSHLLHLVLLSFKASLGFTFALHHSPPAPILSLAPLFLPNIPYYLLPYCTDLALNYTLSCTRVQCFSKFDRQRITWFLKKLKIKWPDVQQFHSWVYTRKNWEQDLKEIVVHPCS